MAVPQSDMQPALTNRQWIFPSLQFTCTATVTGWIFTETSEDIVCPTLELWNDRPFTDTETDYIKIMTLTPDNYTVPTRLSDFVHSCTLNSPVTVSAGTVIGFLTSPQSEGVLKSDVQLIQRENSIGHHYINFAPHKK